MEHLWPFHICATKNSWGFQTRSRTPIALPWPQESSARGLQTIEATLRPLSLCKVCLGSSSCRQTKLSRSISPACFNLSVVWAWSIQVVFASSTFWFLLKSLTIMVGWPHLVGSHSLVMPRSGRAQEMPQMRCAITACRWLRRSQIMWWSTEFAAGRYGQYLYHVRCPGGSPLSLGVPPRRKRSTLHRELGAGRSRSPLGKVSGSWDQPGHQILGLSTEWTTCFGGRVRLLVFMIPSWNKQR